MAILETHINSNTTEFQENTHYFLELIDQLRQRVQQVQQAAVTKLCQTSQRNKLLARERIQLLCDPDTPFVELSPLAARDMYDNDAPSAAL